MQKNEKDTNKEIKDDKKQIKTGKETLKKTESKETEEDRKGIIPEGMDFKKFIGCGG